MLLYETIEEESGGMRGMTTEEGESGKLAGSGGWAWHFSWEQPRN